VGNRRARTHQAQTLEPEQGIQERGSAER
jgi:hypothetical protein